VDYGKACLYGKLESSSLEFIEMLTVARNAAMLRVKVLSCRHGFAVDNLWVSVENKLNSGYCEY